MTMNEQKIPQVVDEKWKAAVADIRGGSLRQASPRKKPILRVAVKSLGGLAAAFALLFTVAVVNPVFAEELPILGDIIRFLKSEDSEVRPPDVLRQNEDIGKEFQAVEAPKGATKLSVREAYCDGSVLIFTVSLEPDEALNQYDVATPYLEVKVNGTDVKPNLRTTEMEKMTDGNFVGMATVDVSGMELNGSISLEVSADQAVAVDRSTYVLYEELREQYTPEELQELVNNMSVRERQNTLGWEELREEFEIAPVSFSGTVTVDESLRRVYEVNEEQNGCAVNSVTVSPSSTLFDFDYPEETTYFITDNLGNKIMPSKMGENSFSMYEPLYKGTTSLTVSFYGLDDRKTPVAVFEVPIEEGYAEKWEPEPYITGDEEITYIPSLPELPEDWLNREPEDIVVQFGETIPLEGDYCNPVTSGEATKELTLSNLRVYDTPEAAGIDPADLIMPELSEFGGKFVLVDVELKNLDGGTSGIGISSYVRPDSKYPGLSHKSSIPEITYFSAAGNGIKNYDAAEVQGELHAQVGFFWSEEDLREGNLQFTLVGDPDDEGQCQYLHMEVPPYEG